MNDATAGGDAALVLADVSKSYREGPQRLDVLKNVSCTTGQPGVFPTNTTMTTTNTSKLSMPMMASRQDFLRRRA